ncbi:hypothetical protein [Sulfurimonas sp. HSL-1716]|uniref:hypothetical protein n=1 Tax=Hydrocurvibacter sulfurireducens TaxID=3131937 RepID=UPI0031F82480
MRFLGHLCMFTSVTFLIAGCSGHTMQDYADKHFNNKKKTNEEVITPSQNKELNTVSPMHKEVKKEVKKEIVTPSQNKELNAVSPTHQNKKDGVMQKSLDAWIEKEWTPTVDKNETIKKMDENESRNFTLQEYVDKVGAYIKNKPKSNEPSMKEKMDKLPVIGK